MKLAKNQHDLYTHHVRSRCCILQGRRVELLLLHIERSQSRFMLLVRTPPDQILSLTLLDVSQGWCPGHVQSGGDAEVCIARLAREHLGILPEKLVEAGLWTLVIGLNVRLCF